MSDYRPSFNLKYLIYRAIKTPVTRLEIEGSKGFGLVGVDLVVGLMYYLSQFKPKMLNEKI